MDKMDKMDKMEILYKIIFLEITNIKTLTIKLNNIIVFSSD